MTDQWKDSDRYRQSPEGRYCFGREMSRRRRRMSPPGVLEGEDSILFRLSLLPLPRDVSVAHYCVCGVRW